MKWRPQGAFVSALRAVFIVLIAAQPVLGMEGFRLLPAPDQDLSLPWRVVESEHFRITFPSHLAGTAELIRLEAEEALALLGEWSGDSLEKIRNGKSRGKKIDIVLCDRSDEANGFVSMGPKGFFLTLYAVYPYGSAAAGLDSYGDWYRSLLVHELAHYLHLDAVEGFSAFCRGLYGTVVHPNTAVPLFYREGFATYAETVSGSTGGGETSGRGDSPITDMYVRASVKEGSFLTLDRASNDTSAWPGAQGHYLFGVSFLDYLAGTGGEDDIHEFNRRSSGRTSYLWNLSFREVYGRGMRQAWREWRTAEEGEQKARIGKISGEGLTDLKPVSGSCGTVYSLDLDTSGRLIVYSIRPPSRLGGLYLYDLDKGKERLLAKGVYAEGVAFGGGGGLIYYLRGEVRKNVYYKKDLFVFDIEKRKEKRITKTGSIQGFVFLENRGTFLLCVSTPRGTRIASLEAGGGMRDLLTESSLVSEEGVPFTVMEDPALSPDGREIAFSCRTSRGEQSICVAEVSALEEGKGVFRRVTPSSMGAYSPQWLNDRVILCVSDEGGVYNLHRVDALTLEREKVSNVVTGLFDARVAGGTAAVKEYTSRGFRVSLLALGEKKPLPGDKVSAGEKPPNDADASSDTETSSDAYLSSGEGAPPGAQPPSGETVRLPGSDDAYGSGKEPEAGVYKPRRWLPPGYWLPFGVGDGIGFGVGLSTSGGDILKRHVYDAGALYDLSDGRLRFRFSYLYNTSLHFSPFLSVAVTEQPPFDEISPDFASYQGIQAKVRGLGAAGRSELGAIVESPYAGPNLLLEYTSLKTQLRWMGPERGGSLRQEAFLNLKRDDFLILTDTFSFYMPFIGPSVLSTHMKIRGGMGDRRNLVTSGSSGVYEFVPLNGILTPGYAAPVNGQIVLNARAKLGFPLFVLERGLHTFPLFLEGAACGLLFDGGIVFSSEGGVHASRSEDEFRVAPSVGALFEDPARYIRTSLGVEIKAGFLAGYEFPLDAVIGYSFALSEGGKSGIYGSLSFGFGL